MEKNRGLWMLITVCKREITSQTCLKMCPSSERTCPRRVVCASYMEYHILIYNLYSAPYNLWTRGATSNSVVTASAKDTCCDSTYFLNLKIVIKSCKESQKMLCV